LIPPGGRGSPVVILPPAATFFITEDEMALDYMPFFVDDFFVSTASMTQSQVGAYTRLLCHCWSEGGLPNDAEACSRIAGGIPPEDWLVIRKRFSVYDEGTSEERLCHKKMEEVRTSVKTKYDKMVASAAKAREARKKSSEINSEIRTEIRAEVSGKAPSNSNSNSNSNSSSLSFSSSGFVGITPQLRARWKSSLPLIDLDHALGKAHLHLCALPEKLAEIEGSGDLERWLTHWLVRESPHRKPPDEKPVAKSWLQDYEVAEYRRPKEKVLQEGIAALVAADQGRRAVGTPKNKTPS